MENPETVHPEKPILIMESAWGDAGKFWSAIG